MADTMMDPDAALKIIEDFQFPAAVETVPLREALGRVLADELQARVDSPPFAKAAMDGYALRSSDDSDRYRIVEMIAAGDVPKKKIDPGQCSKIMTGAMIPEGADQIVRVEYSRESQGWMTVVQAEPQDNIIRQGENLRSGDPLLSPKVLGRQDIGVLASQGYDSVPVSRKPLVGVMTTGSELSVPGQKLSPGHIYDSNGPQLCAQVQAAGARWRSYGVVEDEPEILARAIDGALRECDVLLLSGGVSMGDLDYVPEALKGLGAQLLFHRLAVKPGKPTLFARRDRSFVFGLPGNPVSTFIIFEVFVKPFLNGWMGIKYKPRGVTGTLSQTIKRRDGSRLEYRPVRLEGRRIIPLSYHGSSHLSALREAEALLRIEIGTTRIEEGSELHARLL